MKKIIICLLVVTLLGCGGGTGSGDQTTAETDAGTDTTTASSISDKIVLASNIILEGTANAATKSVTKDADPNLKVMAKNVIIDAPALGIKATNLQDALTELMPVWKPVKFIYGKWTVVARGFQGWSADFAKKWADIGIKEGTVTINPDNTFSYSQDPSDIPPNYFPSYIVPSANANEYTTAKVEILSNKAIQFWCRSSNEDVDRPRGVLHVHHIDDKTLLLTSESHNAYMTLVKN